jgi:hypothetical protein
VSNGNRYRIIVELPKSDGFHTQGDLHLAEILVTRLREFLADSTNVPTGFGDAYARVEADG